MGRQEISGHALGKWALLKGPAILSYRNLFTFVQAQSYQIPQIRRLQSTPKDSNPWRARNFHLERVPLLDLKQLGALGSQPGNQHSVQRASATPTSSSSRGCRLHPVLMVSSYLLFLPNEGGLCSQLSSVCNTGGEVMGTVVGMT